MARRTPLAGLMLVVAAAAILALLAAPTPAEAAGRSLQQSLTCRQAVPKCTSGQCSTLQPSGRLVCNRCRANFAPVIRTIQGAKYIVQCVCPPGQYNDVTTGQCETCKQGMFCTGGQFIDDPLADLGKAVNCSSDGIITTRSKGAQSKSSCVAPAGYSIKDPKLLGTNTYLASPCPVNTYAPNYNRLPACVKCQSGLQEDPADQLGAPGKPARAAVNTVCKVPPGKWYSQNVVKTCAAGLYRGGYVTFRNQSAASCTSCPPGITTLKAGSTSRSDCSRLLSGYGISVWSTAVVPTDPNSYPISSQDASDPSVSSAVQCEVGSYSNLDYNYCFLCPYNTTTRAEGSTSINDCLIPPGYIVSAGNMVPCGDGTFRSGWLAWSSTATCVSCGTNINSTAADVDEDPRVVDGLVRASPASCFIPAGWEVTYNRTGNSWSARACPPNTYGVADVFYGLYTGLVQVPCKACPRGMVTDPPGKVANNDSDACTNPAGYGYSSEGATPCAPGFWAAYNSKLPCAQCAAGRTTVDDSAQQVSVQACTIMQGFGVSASDPLIAAAAGDPDKLAAIPAQECDVGYYQNDTGLLLAYCTQCNNGTTTPGTGYATCSDCAAGYGRPALNTGNCTACALGTYARAGDGVCSSCERTEFSNVYGSNIFTSNGTTTFPGARGSEFCVPLVAHLAQDAGQFIYLSGGAAANLTTSATKASAVDCTSSCGGDQCCIAAWTSSTGKCDLTSMLAVSSSAPPTGGDLQLMWKLPPSNRVAASSKLGAKVMSSGIYSRCQVPASTLAAVTDFGTGLKISQGSLAGGDAVLKPTYDSGTTPYSSGGNLSLCTDACDGSSMCWGVIVDSSGNCNFRSGEDALGVDTFFVMPSNSSVLGTLGW